MEHMDLARLRALNEAHRRQQEALKAAQAEEPKEEVAEGEQEAAPAPRSAASGEKPAKKPSKRKYLVVDDEAPKETEGE